MRVSVEASEGLQRKLMIEVPAEKIDSEVERRIVETAKTANLPGFRRGKVPVKVVRQRFGSGLRSEVIGQVLGQTFQEAVTQEKITPFGTPDIEVKQNEFGQDLHYLATFEVYPEVTLEDFSSIQVVQRSCEITDADIEQMIEKLRNQQATWAEVERAAQDGDKVNIDFEGKKDGEPFAGGASQGHDLELGSGAMIEGFESGLVGMSANEETVLDLTFPEDYQSPELQGAQTTFDVKVNSVSEKTLPELNAEFFALFEVDGDLDAFKQNVRESMDAQLEQSIRNHTKKQVMDALCDLHDVDIPQAMIAEDIKALRQQAKANMGAGAADIDDSLLPDDLFTEQSQRRVTLALILNKIGEQHNLSIEQSEMMALLDELAASYDDPEQVKEFYLQDASRMEQLQLVLIERKSIEKVLELAQCSEENVSYDEAMSES